MMTERPLSITTQIATPIPPAPAQPTATATATAAAAAPISTSEARPVRDSAADEEPYTIKCICDFSDDDGNTIYCETCDTWQHIECFYPGQVDDASKEEFDHSCADCKPRPGLLDRRLATERQRHQRQNKAVDSPDKKTKRPPSKSHKKKAKPADLQVNGHHEADHHKHGSPPPAQPKKAKGHRPHQSVSSQPVKRSPPITARPQHAHAHPPSPAHTPPDLPTNFPVYGYSERFLQLYDNDDAIPITTTNSFANLSVSNSMGLWLSDAAKMHEDTGIRKEDVFDYLKVPVDSLRWPELRVERRQETDRGVTFTRKCLVNVAHITGTLPIGELNGVVGTQNDYCNDVENRWTDMAHPRPFVFFIPHLPLYIDTRTEGSMCRYVRRSCRPNTDLGIFIAQRSEYHFWLTPDRPLAANEEVTMPWEFKFPAQLSARLYRLLNLSDDDGGPPDGIDTTDDEYDLLRPLIHTVLSDHGGCACNLGNDCAFARFHRAYQARQQALQLHAVKSRKGRKPKQSHVSPTSTGHATNSRDASEGQDEEDNRSAAGSVRSKPRSRDLTPSRGSGGEPSGILTEHSEREKRKLAALEDSFRKMEQGQPPRKKKRASEGSAPPAAGGQPGAKPRQRSAVPRRASVSQAAGPAVNGSKSRQYADASTASRRESGSPSSVVSPSGTRRSPDGLPSLPYRSRHSSAQPKPAYVDASMQTDEVENAWWNDPKPTPKRRIVSLALKLLKNRQQIRRQQSAHALRRQASTNSAEGEEDGPLPIMPMDVDPPSHADRHTHSPSDAKDDRNPSVASPQSSADASTPVDVAMPDAPTVPDAAVPKPPPPTWPTPTSESHPPHKLPRLKMPSAPLLSPSTGSTPIVETPTKTPASLKSPFPPTPTFSSAPANGITPSPVKPERKKLSLSDYAAKRKKTNAMNAERTALEHSPTMAPAVLKPSLSTIEEAKAQGGPEGSAFAESPLMVAAIPNPLAMAGSPAGPSSLKDPATTSEKPNGTL